MLQSQQINPFQARLLWGLQYVSVISQAGSVGPYVNRVYRKSLARWRFLGFAAKAAFLCVLMSLAAFN